MFHRCVTKFKDGSITVLVFDTETGKHYLVKDTEADALFTGRLTAEDVADSLMSDDEIEEWLR